MIMPSKHINVSQSLLGLGSYILSKMDKPYTIDELWNKYQTDLEYEIYSVKHGFDNFVLTFIFLYSINAINYNNEFIIKCN